MMVMTMSARTKSTANMYMMSTDDDDDDDDDDQR